MTLCLWLLVTLWLYPRALFQKIWGLLHVHNHQAVNFVRAGRKLDMSRERRAWKWPETIHLVNNKRPWAENKKAEISELTRNHTFWGDKCPGGRQRKWGNGRNLWFLHVTFAHYALITIKLALQVRSIHLALIPWHFWSKLNKGKNPSWNRRGPVGFSSTEALFSPPHFW